MKLLILKYMLHVFTNHSLGLHHETVVCNVRLSMLLASKCFYQTRHVVSWALFMWVPVLTCNCCTMLMLHWGPIVYTEVLIVDLSMDPEDRVSWCPGAPCEVDSPYGWQGWGHPKSSVIGHWWGTGVDASTLDSLTHCTILKTTFSNQLSRIVVLWFKFHWSLLSKVWINSKPWLVRVMTWCQTGNKPMSEHIMVKCTVTYMHYLASMS